MTRYNLKAILAAMLMLVSFAAHAVWNTDLGAGFINAAAAPYSAAPIVGSTCAPANDVTGVVQNALDDVAAAGGGTVYLPTGRYCIYSSLLVRDFTVLKGVFEAPPTGRLQNLFDGSVGTTLLAMGNKNNAAGPALISLLGRGSGVNGVAIWHPEQTYPSGSTWTPVQYPWAIMATNDDVSIQNILILNAFLGIKLDYAGRHYVRGIYGQPIANGIVVEHIYDVGRISDVHFWPFWSLQPSVLSWIQSNGIAFIFHRTDWQVVENVFGYGYRMGMAFNKNTDPPPYGGGANGTMTNINFDAAQFGIVIYDNQPPGIHITNLNVALTSPSPGTAIANLAPAGSSAHLNVTSGSVWGVPGTSVQWNGAGLLMLSGLRILTSPTTGPSIVINAGQAIITGNTIPSNTTSGVGIKVGASAGKVFIGSNMLFGKTVQNLGSQTTLTANSP